MNTYKRFGNRWTVNECLQLQREFELLQLSVDEISKIHQRTPNAIMFKLDQEGFADYNVLFANYAKTNQKNVVKYDESSDESEEDESESEDDESDDNVSVSKSEDNVSLKQRVIRLEKQISSLASLILENTNSKKNRSFLY
jgi:hypothetical protein